MANILLGYWYRLYSKQTKQEQKVEAAICKLGIRYRTQHPFLAQRAFADFYFPDHDLVVEVDDPSHEEPKKIKKDLERTKRLQALGLTILRFKNDQIDNNLPDVLRLISERINRETKVPSSDDPASLPQQLPSQFHPGPARPTHVPKERRKRSRSS